MNHARNIQHQRRHFIWYCRLLVCSLAAPLAGSCSLVLLHLLLQQRQQLLLRWREATQRTSSTAPACSSSCCSIQA